MRMAKVKLDVVLMVLLTIVVNTKAILFNFALPKNSSTRIVGGTDVPQNEYVPYQISLQYRTKDGYRHFCGGSIISPSRVLTAAHCCQGMNANRMSIVAGIRDLNAPERGIRSQVVSYDIHDDYKELITSDLAILSIEPPLELNNKTIAAIDVSDKDYIGGGVPVTLTGWGLRLPVPFPFIEFLNFPTVLQRMDYQTITTQQCRDTGMQEVTNTEICSRGPFRGACSGDSGGPLVTSTSRGLKQVGIVSYGMIVCGLFVAPDVYTRVSTFSDWITERLE